MESNIAEHSLTVVFEDTVTDLEAITKALNDVGYTVGEAEKVEE